MITNEASMHLKNYDTTISQHNKCSNNVQNIESKNDSMHEETTNIPLKSKIISSLDSSMISELKGTEQNYNHETSCVTEEYNMPEKDCNKFHEDTSTMDTNE